MTERDPFEKEPFEAAEKDQWEQDWGTKRSGGNEWQHWVNSVQSTWANRTGPGFGGFAGGGGHRPGPPPWLQDLVRGFGGPEARGSRSPKVRRGDVRTAILAVLNEQPMNGYQVIQRISERTDGAWKPSPGSVYPTIQQLEDEGLVEGREREGRRELLLTKDGRHWVAEHPDEVRATWSTFQEPPPREEKAGRPDLKPVAGQVMSAVWQIMVSGTDQQRAEAIEILGETRRNLYGLLAEGEPE